MAQGYSSDGHTIADHLFKIWPKDIHRTATLLQIIYYLKKIMAQGYSSDGHTIEDHLLP